MTDNIPVQVNIKYAGIYRCWQEHFLQTCDTGDGCAGLFSLCVCLGFRDFQVSGVRPDEFAGADLLMFSRLDAHQQTVLKTIAIKIKDYEVLTNPAEIIALAEKFAERGMEILIEGVFHPYIRELRHGEFVLDIPQEGALEKSLALFIQAHLIRNSLL